jgi:hypothetical protein
VGIIDRHNYFGGGTGHTLKSGSFNNESMLSRPGAGLLSSGMQQVHDSPFSISEWLSLIPNEWTAESTPIVSVYGMGLQGWDASFSFASDYPFFTSTLHTPGVYNVMSPLQISLYPAISRMIYREDITEGEIISERNVSLQSLKDGKLGFFETVAQQNDVKEIQGFVEQEKLAVGRIVVDFTGEFKKSENSDVSKFIDHQNSSVRSTTGELNWDYSGKGFFTVNTPATQAFVGFSPNESISFNDIEIYLYNKFGVVIITTFEKNSKISNTDRLFITAVGRAVNTDMKYDFVNSEIIEVGRDPILLEPMKFDLKFPNRQIVEVNKLDHVGKKVGKYLKSDSNKVFIDGSYEKTIYYEIVLK